MQKKSIIFIFFIIIFQIVFSKEVYSKNINYLALGDSIAYGYGLEDIDNDSYTQRVRKELTIDENSYKNLAISGMTCKKYFEKIQEENYKNNIKKADLITISIGSNEILQIASYGIEKGTGAKADKDSFFTEVQQKFNKASIVKRYDMARKIYEYFNSEECNKSINENLQVYEEYWNKTIDFIKSINENAIIVATEFYNPYYGIKIGNYDVGSYSDKPIRKMNEILWKYSDGEKKYKIAKIYDEFNNDETKMTNAETDTSVTRFQINMDPHPNKNGHRVISQKIMDNLLDYNPISSIDIEKTIMSKDREAGKIDNKSNSLRAMLIVIAITIIIIITKLKNKNKEFK